ncbi:efflux RND transporter periplasmic adaptor subunit [Mucilaginibacter ginkgonis]|uniref:Efflux RND transporter periplasmic adaptor subunit n=1 Tax=Mucilaginibacter ginkgonis TaxID=2682091 RepID=A0A6I4HYY8_9SPHI|nr:efflux RND transporter periplasmic adaptor subunit [Mucilaginibacter ginkgonis]QQL48645.1 efflux RND transporter periplasmic adaptor subunit [Mucilaginibacter ginkgonis]
MKIFKSPLLIALPLIIGLAAGCSGDKKEKEEQEEVQKQEAAVDTPAVQVFDLKKGILTSSIQVPGELAPYQQVDLYAKTNSYVKKLLVDVGSQVHTGQLLVTLDAPEVQSQLAEAKAKIAQQEALYLSSKSQYDRYINTAKTPGTIAQNDIDQAAARKNADYANVQAAKSFYKQIATGLGYLEIRAPFDGVVTARNINVGAYVGPSGKGSDQPLLVVQQQSRLRLIVSIPENYTAGLNNKDEVEFTVKSLPNQKFTAKVSRLAGALDSKLRAERLEMDVYNKSKNLLPGMYAEVNVPLPSHDSSFVVPKTAVVNSTEKVFVISIEDNRAKWLNVKKGLETSDSIEVFGPGLKPNIKLVMTANDEIRDGSPVISSAAKAVAPKKTAE